MMTCLPLLRRSVLAPICAGVTVAFTLSTPAFAELIPSVRLVPWTPGVTVGVPGGIKTRTSLVDVTKPPYNVDNTGRTNASPGIQRAIDSVPYGSVIFLPAGRYKCDATLYFSGSRDNLTLRGAGPSTVIEAGQTSTAIFVGTASDWNWAWPTKDNFVTSGLQKGSSTVTIGNTSAFNVGQLIRFVFQNDTNIPVTGVGIGDYLRRQMCVVTAKTPTTLTFKPPLYDDYGAGTLKAKVNVAQLQVDFVGIEDLTVDYSKGNGIFGIQFEQAYGCWVKGVRVIKPANYGFFLYDSAFCEVRRSFADQRKGSGSNGAGLLSNTSSACLVEDNIFYKFFPIVEINQGSSGNVIAYNFCEDSTVFGSVGAGIDSNHGPHNSFNLYEGNIAPNLQCDGYFGGASHDTVFRNWFHTAAPNGAKGGKAVILNRFTRHYSMVGNLLGMSGFSATWHPYSFGNPNMGNGSSSGTAQPSKGDWWVDWGTAAGPGGFQEMDLDVQATTLLKGNYHVGQRKLLEPLDAPLPNSLYLSAKPSWFGELSWPPFSAESASSLSYTNLPAGLRFVLGYDPSFGNRPSRPKGLGSAGP